MNIFIVRWLPLCWCVYRVIRYGGPVAWFEYHDWDVYILQGWRIKNIGGGTSTHEPEYYALEALDEYLYPDPHKPVR